MHIWDATFKEKGAGDCVDPQRLACRLLTIAEFAHMGRASSVQSALGRIWVFSANSAT